MKTTRENKKRSREHIQIGQSAIKLRIAEYIARIAIGTADRLCNYYMAQVLTCRSNNGPRFQFYTPNADR